MRRSPQRAARCLAAVAALALALAPALAPIPAEARPGGGFSSGSRGSRTYSAPPMTRTAPGGSTGTFDRTETPRGTYGNPGAATPGYGQAAPTYRPAPAGGGLGGGFMSGLMGGLLGAGIAGMLFGHGGFGGMSGGAGFLGFLLQIGLLALIAMFVVRFLRRRALGGASGGMMGGARPAMAGGVAGGNGYARAMDNGNGAQRGPAGGRAPVGTPIEVGAADFDQFGRSLLEINAAWSRGDRAALTRLTTPEMARYFTGDLDDLAARGWRNETRDVQLESGDLAEAWRENGTDYATAAMRFSLVDVTRDASGRVVEGDPQARQVVTELWTFARRNNGPWLLSAIQQAR
ncbi:Tim44 domain-containing protein [Roseomonas elaeocarpi]|uniref:Tim44 domain-containing protein n=1 Tax=Roseomonas elaeocarpi TaxID=907779 RepID=A0ABV6JZE7_9PROT